MSRKILSGTTLAACVVLTLVWAMLALSGSALANPPDGNGNHNHGAGGGSGPETFMVTIKTVEDVFGPVVGPVWTDGPQIVQAANKENWLHVFDSGGNGTRGRPNFDNAAFSTNIFLQPLMADVTVCSADPDDMSDPLRDLLFSKLDQPLRKVVFDFQVSYDIAENPMAFSFFLFRWEDGDEIFSASTGFGLLGSDPAPTIVFLGDGDDTNNPDLIDDPTKPRVFQISGAKVIARELNKNKVIATLACPNEYTIEVTVAPVSP